MPKPPPRPPEGDIPLSYFVDSFISILHFVSDDLVQADATTQIGELFCDEFDDLDLELAICCFEATHKVSFRAKLWETEPEDYEDLNIEEFIETYVDGTEQRDPLFVTKRFLMFQDSLTKALTEEDEDLPGEQSY